MRIRAFLSILVIFLTFQLNARPVRHAIFTFTQPDGSTFPALCRGDEFLKINTTVQGHAIVRDAEGWWCYAIYDTDGSRKSSGYRVGGDVPYDVLSESKDIPFDVLASNAEKKRVPFVLEGDGILKRTMKAQGARLLSETTVKKHGIVILAEYSDVSFKHERQDFVNLLTGDGYSINGATGSAKEYFDSQFDGMFDFDFEVSEIVTLKSRRTYYGQNNSHGDDTHPAEMIEEACILADKVVDFSLYDDDADGLVDNVFVIFAGEDEADDPDKNADCIWSHSWYIKSGAGITLELDGKTIDQYACTSELMAGGTITGIGTFCHEFAHTLGLPDLYDTDYEKNDGWAAGLWVWTSLMDGGNQNNNFNTPPYFNAIEREILKLSEPMTLGRNGSYTIQPIHKSGQYYKIPSEKDTEYYLLEYRGHEGWDKYIGGSGMLVYHIDKSDPKVWLQNTVNTKPTHQYADLIEADGRNDVLNADNYIQMTSQISSIFFPYANVTELTPDSNPGIKFWQGSKVEISITDIERKDGAITFIVSGLQGEVPPIPVNMKADTYMDAAIISFESDRPFEGKARMTWGRTGQETESVSIPPYETGKYAILIEGLTPGNKTYTASVCFEYEGMQSQSKKVSFMTTKTAPVNWPYIYSGKKANEDGTFDASTKIPLRVYNAATAEAVTWEFNGKEVSPSGDGYFTIHESGVLRATVYWPEGSTDILEKHIILSE